MRLFKMASFWLNHAEIRHLSDANTEIVMLQSFIGIFPPLAPNKLTKVVTITDHTTPN